VTSDVEMERRSRCSRIIVKRKSRIKDSFNVWFVTCSQSENMENQWAMYNVRRLLSLSSIPRHWIVGNGILDHQLSIEGMDNDFAIMINNFSFP
jgi:hypothetical protein